jgi:dihydroorotase-like cyclic amidohydrolase
VLVDLSAERVLEDALVVSKAGWTPYAGRRVKGRIVKTLCRGELVAEDGRPAARAGSGRFIAGPGRRAA